ncbi:MAG: hypothetical protein ACRCX2_15970 [Paraclostridium sp.]
MKVICVDNHMCEFLLKRNETYVVVRETDDSYLIMVDRVGWISFDKDRFVIAKEEKMDQVRIVRKLEDLDRLENDKGLKVHWCEVDKCLEIYFNSRFIDRVFSIDRTDVLKAMGFKFEYKPLRSLEEVINEIESMESLEFNINGNNFFIAKSHGSYYVENHNVIEILGATFMEKEQAQKYADELNEIIGVGK